MHYYQIIINKRVPYPVLTYKSEEVLVIGTIVEVALRKKLVHGVVVKLENEQGILDPKKITEISNIYPYKFSELQMKFHNIFSYNTFNDIHNTLDGFLQPLLQLNQKQTESLRSIDTSLIYNINNQKQPTQYIISPHIVLRIRDIIRISIDGYYKSFSKTSSTIVHTILILFPEKKLLESVKLELDELGLLPDEILSQQIQIQMAVFYGDKAKSSRDATMNLLLDQTTSKPTVNVIFGTRSSLFLPYTHIDDIILVDEANSMYIQEQNGLYFDARDVTVIMSQVFGAQLNFVSRVPSIRLHNMYQKEDFEKSIIKDVEMGIKTLKTQITRSSAKHDKYKLISDDVLRMIMPNQDGMEKVWVEDGETEV